MRAQTKLATAALLGTALAIAASSAAAQPSPGDTRWRAWVGCWEPVAQPGTMAPDASSLRVCVVPAGSPSAVDVVNIANGKETSRTRIDASGDQHTIGRDGCTGVEQAQWAPSNARVYLRGEITCDGVRRTTSGLLAFASNGQWIDVQGVTTGKQNGVHVTRYRPVETLTGVPAEIASAIPNAPLAQSTARSAAIASLGTEDVIDATRHAESAVVEAWLAERGQGFDLDAKKLVALADAGVPGRVTDLMVALTYPTVFAVNPGARQTEMTKATGTQVAGRTIPVTATECYGSAFGYGYGGFYSPYAYDSCAYRYGAPYGRYGYGYGYGYSGYGYGYSGPIVIIRPGDGTSSGVTTRPHAVAGRGYTEGRSSSPSSGSSNVSSSSGSSGSSSGASSSGASSPSSGSASSGSSSGGGERTAHPRVP